MLFIQTIQKIDIDFICQIGLRSALYEVVNDGNHFQKQSNRFFTNDDIFVVNVSM